MDWLAELRGWGWFIVLLLGVLYMALRDKLGFDFVRRREFTEMILNIERVEKHALGAHDKLGDLSRRQDALEQRVATIDEHGSEPTRELMRTLGKIQTDMAEIKTHLKYLRAHTGKD